ncbi:pentatricopeptide repeat-containing protein At1g31430-like [Cornus florida]|uniref:pentatricopeptide repeat-containing protein At1g31430-like n=1 Tax=Cornus florida TaxID=4283 RepID=UPI002898F545|nr:pentatricopeptide repeat-containing protein At1g31430-like [Cornus florida]
MQQYTVNCRDSYSRFLWSRIIYVLPIHYIFLVFFMKLAGLFPRSSTSATPKSQPERVFKNLISNDAIEELHAHLIRTQRHTDSISMSAVIRAYALSPTSLAKAHLAFDQIIRPALPNWNYMIRGTSQSDRPIEAIRMFDRMRGQGLVGDNLTFIFVFKACGRVSDIVHGRKVHVHGLKLGFELYLYVSNALIHMYASCGDLGSARKLFDEMPDRDLVSWNSLICGYSQCRRYKEVLGLFDAMRVANVKADGVTMMKVILACSHLGDRKIADSMVKYIEDNDVEIGVYLGNTLIDMYGRFGLVGLAREVFDRMEERKTVSWNAMIMGYTKVRDLVAARKLFDGMPKRDVISWTSMITGYSQANQFSDAVRLFREMMVAKVKPDEITVASVLSACAHLGILDVGKGIHDYIRENNVKEDVYVGNSLIDMYCKCGVVKRALEVFHKMKEKDSVSWTSVISGLSVNGFGDHAIELFSQMLREGFRPTHGAFVGVLVACVHAGLVEKGLEYFRSMENDYGLLPEMKHYGCVVDLLSRSGNLDQAYEFIKQMPMAPDVVIWRMLLSACNLHGNVALAEIATNKLLKLDPCNSGNYVLSSNSYASADRWDDATKMRELMEDGDVQKPLGWSSIEVGISSNSSQEQCLLQS